MGALKSLCRPFCGRFKLFSPPDSNEGWVGGETWCPLRVGDYSEPRVLKAQADEHRLSSEILSPGTISEIASHQRKPPRFARRPVCIGFSGQKRIGDFLKHGSSRLFSEMLSFPLCFRFQPISRLDLRTKRTHEPVRVLESEVKSSLWTTDVLHTACRVSKLRKLGKECDARSRSLPPGSACPRLFFSRNAF